MESEDCSGRTTPLSNLEAPVGTLDQQSTDPDRPRSARGMYPRTLNRCIRLVGGLGLFAAGIVLLVRSGLGASPWDVFHTGVEYRTPWTLGTVIILSAGVVCVVAAKVGVRPGLGTVADVILVGVFVDVLHPLLGPASGMTEKVAYMVTGTLLFGAATGVYASARFGLGPRDALMLAWHRRTSSPLWWVRLRLEGAAVLTGAVLGGQFGPGTFFFAFTIGPVAHLAIRFLAPELESRPVAFAGVD